MSMCHEDPVAGSQNPTHLSTLRSATSNTVPGYALRWESIPMNRESMLLYIRVGGLGSKAS